MNMRNNKKQVFSHFKVLALAFYISFLSGCITVAHIESYDGPKELQKVDFCDLDSLESGDYVTTLAYYTRIGVSWRLTSGTECAMDEQVYLSAESDFVMGLRNKLDKEFSTHCRVYIFLLEVKGFLEKSEGEFGYGNLGLRKMQIVPYEIRLLKREKIDIDVEG